ncbi:hypothetical protein GCM10023148_54600 [Actinokineospora soli]
MVAVRVGAAAACLGALLGLVAGIGRTTLAMARERDLPPLLSTLHGSVPRVAQVAVGVVVCGLVLVADLRGVVGFSSFGVLVYYAVANACAYKQRGRWLHAVGLAGCVLLVATLPTWSVLIGLAVFAAGLLGRLAIRS